MLKVYYADVSALDITEKMQSYFSESRLEKLRKSKNKKTCAGVEALLCYSVFGKPSYYYGKNGKPYFNNGEQFFSLSHSGCFVACAISDKPVGVDIQQVRAYRPATAERILNESENLILQNSTDKEKTFCYLWAKKEAVAKKRGGGIGEILKGIHTDAQALELEDYCLVVCGEGEAEFIEVTAKEITDFFEGMN